MNSWTPEPGLKITACAVEGNVHRALGDGGEEYRAETPGAEEAPQRKQLPLEFLGPKPREWPRCCGGGQGAVQEGFICPAKEL